MFDDVFQRSFWIFASICMIPGELSPLVQNSSERKKLDTALDRVLTYVTVSMDFNVHQTADLM